MKYSNVILNDDNFDEEFEHLCEIVKLPYSSYENFIDKLPNHYTKQIHSNGFDEWICCKTIPNKGSDFKQAYQVGTLAYEFKNGFIILNFETLL